MAGCQRNSGFTVGENQRPVISDVLVNPADPVTGETVVLNAIAVDENGDPLTYNWKVTSGKLARDGTGNPINYETAPTDSGYISVSCIVSDGKATSSLSKVIRMRQAKAALMGFITDGASHQMVEGAMVSLDTEHSRTRENGYFRFENLPVNTPRLLSVNKSGYKVFTTSIECTPGVNTMNVALDKIPGNVSGIITDRDTDNPLKNVQVALSGFEDSTTFSGYFRFENVPTGTHTIIAKKNGYLTLRKMVEIKPGENNLEIKL